MVKPKNVFILLVIAVLVYGLCRCIRLVPLILKGVTTNGKL